MEGVGWVESEGQAAMVSLLVFSVMVMVQCTLLWFAEIDIDHYWGKSQYE